MVVVVVVSSPQTSSSSSSSSPLPYCIGRSKGKKQGESVKKSALPNAIRHMQKPLTQSEPEFERIVEKYRARLDSSNIELIIINRIIKFAPTIVFSVKI